MKTLIITTILAFAAIAFSPQLQADDKKACSKGDAASCAAQTGCAEKASCSEKASCPEKAKACCAKGQKKNPIKGLFKAIGKILGGKKKSSGCCAAETSCSA